MWDVDPIPERTPAYRFLLFITDLSSITDLLMSLSPLIWETFVYILEISMPSSLDEFLFKTV